MQTSIIQKVIDALNASGSPGSAVTSALAALAGNETIGKSCVMIFKPETDSLTAIGAHGIEIDEFRRIETLAGRSAVGRVFESGNREIVDADRSIGLNPSPGRSAIIEPLRLDGRTIGVILIETDDASAATKSLVGIVAGLLANTFKIENAIAAERSKLVDESVQRRQELKEKYDFSKIIGNSSAMRQVYDQVSQVARSNATVLLRGESGTGKEMIAHAIHYNSLRSKGPFIKVNCAALPESLIESELFGYEKGAFTGAERLKKGRFEMADGGTIFLDEIGDLPPQTQVKLLRVIQEREIQRLGGTQTVKVNVRFITATNKNLEQEIAEGVFREDLYYRLNVFSIFLPALRERKSDILLLAEHFLEKYSSEHGKNIKRISTPAIDMLTSYHFPGNVRELENVIERAVIVCDEQVIHGHHLPPSLQTADVSGTVTQLSLTAAVEAYERDLIQDALKTTRGNVAKAARLLDSTERILSYKIRKYEVEPKRFK